MEITNLSPAYEDKNLSVVEMNLYSKHLKQGCASKTRLCSVLWRVVSGSLEKQYNLMNVCSRRRQCFSIPPKRGGGAQRESVVCE